MGQKQLNTSRVRERVRAVAATDTNSCCATFSPASIGMPRRMPAAEKEHPETSSDAFSAVAFSAEGFAPAAALWRYA
eukprot:CAMPEP_0116979008 /NCGR_PEP_ID=MMETSP0467-20121206/58162_1 /TAXON_ID=283647 /ORGANISM="Mesodinium pulex, Strain SPMC105" /LENGTH=76 /DNA_ID=CAMNT_0004672569 /DNA_START=16 /DNA_END=243 /DNA_ORIENTATION=-